VWASMGLSMARKMPIEGLFRGCDAQSQCRWGLDGKKSKADDAQHTTACGAPRGRLPYCGALLATCPCAQGANTWLARGPLARVGAPPVHFMWLAARGVRELVTPSRSPPSLHIRCLIPTRPAPVSPSVPFLSPFLPPPTAFLLVTSPLSKRRCCPTLLSRSVTVLPPTSTSWSTMAPPRRLTPTVPADVLLLLLAAAVAVCLPPAAGKCLERLETHPVEFDACRRGTMCFLFVPEPPLVIVDGLIDTDTPDGPRTPFPCGDAAALHGLRGVSFDLHDKVAGLWPGNGDLCAYAGGPTECTFTELVAYMTNVQEPTHPAYGMALGVAGMLVHTAERSLLALQSASIFEVLMSWGWVVIDAGGAAPGYLRRRFRLILTNLFTGSVAWRFGCL